MTSNQSFKLKPLRSADSTFTTQQKGSRMRAFFVALAVIFALTGCANPSVVRVKEAEIGRIAVTKVFVPRFEGNPDFVEESTNLFIAELESRISASVIQGSALRPESTDVLAGGNLAPTEPAIAKAKEVGAQVLVMGKVTSHNTAGMLNGFSTVRLIDVATGSILASFHRPSGKLIASSEHQTVMAAVSRTADDVAKALE